MEPQLHNIDLGAYRSVCTLCSWQENKLSPSTWSMLCGYVYLLRWQVHHIKFHCYSSQEWLPVCFSSKRAGLQQVALRIVNTWEEPFFLRYQWAKRGPFETLHQPLTNPRKTLTSLSRRRLPCLQLENRKLFGLWHRWLFRHVSSGQRRSNHYDWVSGTKPEQ